MRVRGEGQGHLRDLERAPRSLTSHRSRSCRALHLHTCMYAYIHAWHRWRSCRALLRQPPMTMTMTMLLHCLLIR